MNRKERRKYMKNVKSFKDYTCTECGNTFVILNMKDGSGDVLCSHKPEEMCMECYNRYLECEKARMQI